MEKNEGPLKHGLIVIGGSAGALNVVVKLLENLPTGFPVPVIIVLHRLNIADDTLIKLLLHKSNLPVKEAEEKEPILAGKIYIAPADYHLLIENNLTISLDVSEKVQFSRPSIDVTFESAAAVYGKALIGVLLSGASSDGTEGIKAIKAAGGMAIIQSPDDAEVSYMPSMALQSNKVDIVTTAQLLASTLIRLV